ncbi:hypothetical protein PMAG_a1771 [Pseudoalteromonas mariniglutinosa NCIMB 1770]|nr:hypothetical protein [Pseudoalteromonas mariniglutinosa NCIMB 1770]
MASIIQTITDAASVFYKTPINRLTIKQPLTFPYLNQLRSG